MVFDASAVLEMVTGVIEEQFIHCQNNGLCSIDCGGQLDAVQHEGRFHGGMADPLVAIHEGMVLDQGEPQRCCFGIQSWVKINTAKTLVGLGDGGLQQAQVPQTGHASARLSQSIRPAGDRAPGSS